MKLLIKKRVSNWKSFRSPRENYLLRGHGRPQWGQGGHCPPPGIWKIMTSYAAVLQNTLNIFASAFGARHRYLYLSLKRRKNAKIFVCAFGALQKWSIFVRHTENVSIFYSVGGFAPSGKISVGAHVRGVVIISRQKTKIVFHSWRDVTRGVSMV